MLYIKDLLTGEVRPFGTNVHDALVIEPNGRALYYRNLQNGDGSLFGSYQFVTSDKGMIPYDDSDIREFGYHTAMVHLKPDNTEDCEGCKYENKSDMAMPCIRCIRNNFDRYEKREE